MEVAEILARFERFNGNFELEAVEAAIAQKEEVTPELLAVLEELSSLERAIELDENSDYMAHFYALMLLAQFRETRAYPLVLKIARFPNDALESLFGDFTSSHFGPVLASICGGDIEGIQLLIESPAVDQWVRIAAIESLVILFGAGLLDFDTIVAYFRELFHGRLSDEVETVWGELVCACLDIYAPQLRGEIKEAYDRGLVDTQMVGLNDAEAEFRQGDSLANYRLHKNPHLQLIRDTVKEMGCWDCFKNKKKRNPLKVDALTSSQDAHRFNHGTGFKREFEKIGRNDPCPCLSGKKYKKCCGAAA